jgi:hypothetical protein
MESNYVSLALFPPPLLNFPKWRPNSFLHVAAAALAYFIAYLVLKIRTDRNHDNLTNEEMDWKQELGKIEATNKSV